MVTGRQCSVVSGITAWIILPVNRTGFTITANAVSNSLRLYEYILPLSLTLIA